MTNAQLIGKETMLARLVVFHTARFERNSMAWKASEYVGYLKSLSTRKLSKEYDETFSETKGGYSVETESTIAEMNGTLVGNIVEYSAALMG